MGKAEGTDSNLHSLSAGGFQDLKVRLEPEPTSVDLPIKTECAAIKVIQVRVGLFPSARLFRERPLVPLLVPLLMGNSTLTYG